LLHNIRENPQPYFFIRVNQVGFAPSDVKTAIAVIRESLPEQFHVMNTKTGVVVFRGDVKPIPESWGQFNVHGEVDFSSVTQEGDYIVAVVTGRLISESVAPLTPSSRISC
jgi:hypothetical protein